MYADGAIPKGHRALMQFALVRENGPERFREWERDFRDILAYIESIAPPKYPFAIDRRLADAGRSVFERSCSRCHGRYGAGNSTWPEQIVPIDEVRTDPVRLHAMTPAARAHYANSWFGDYGAAENWHDPEGYVAPPLDGVWASAPYFHNGSVPTLWHVLHPCQRPSVWRRTSDEYDRDRIGMTVEAIDATPSEVRTLHERRHYFDTSLPGKSNAGHTFPDELSPTERAAVLEYLKTL
jgi:mono/diheme cytochrome c family protein